MIHKPLRWLVLRSLRTQVTSVYFNSLTYAQTISLVESSHLMYSNRNINSPIYPENTPLDEWTGTDQIEKLIDFIHKTHESSNNNRTG